MMPNFGTLNPNGPTGPSKTELRRQIAEAMENTVALQEGRPLAAPKPVQAVPVPKARKIAPAAPVEAPVRVSQETGPSNDVEKIDMAPVGELARVAKPLTSMSFPDEIPINPAIRRAPSVMPTADQVGRAIVAACRETGAAPLEINGGMGMAIVHARYYAMHAIEHCFPGLSSRVYARVVGAGKNFYSASKQSVIRMVSPNRRQAAWWNEAAYARVIKAIEDR